MSVVVGLIAAIVGASFVAMIPNSSIDRFSLAALSLPAIWVLVCLHILLSRRPLEWSVAYVVLAAVLPGLSLIYGAIA